MLEIVSAGFTRTVDRPKARCDALALPPFRQSHGAAGLLYAAGNDIIEFAAVLGHAKPDMSLMYTDATSYWQAKAISSLSEMLGFR